MKESRQVRILLNNHYVLWNSFPSLLHWRCRTELHHETSFQANNHFSFVTFELKSSDSLVQIVPTNIVFKASLPPFPLHYPPLPMTTHWAYSSWLLSRFLVTLCIRRVWIRCVWLSCSWAKWVMPTGHEFLSKWTHPPDWSVRLHRLLLPWCLYGALSLSHQETSMAALLLLYFVRFLVCKGNTWMSLMEAPRGISCPRLVSHKCPRKAFGANASWFTPPAFPDPIQRCSSSLVSRSHRMSVEKIEWVVRFVLSA